MCAGEGVPDVVGVVYDEDTHMPVWVILMNAITGTVASLPAHTLSTRHDVS